VPTMRVIIEELKDLELGTEVSIRLHRTRANRLIRPRVTNPATLHLLLG